MAHLHLMSTKLLMHLVRNSSPITRMVVAVIVRYLLLHALLSIISDDPLFDYNTVYLALRCTKNSTAGFDHLPGRFYRSLAADLVPSLSIIFQQSFYSCHIPDMWRMATFRHVF